MFYLWMISGGCLLIVIVAEAIISYAQYAYMVQIDSSYNGEGKADLSFISGYAHEFARLIAWVTTGGSLMAVTLALIIYDVRTVFSKGIGHDGHHKEYMFLALGVISLQIFCLFLFMMLGAGFWAVLLTGTIHSLAKWGVNHLADVTYQVKYDHPEPIRGLECNMPYQRPNP